MAGINRADKKRDLSQEGFKSNDKPCIFLSHISIDKEQVQSIANYIMEKADIDIYLDIHDEELQKAVREGNPDKITNLIESGISQSSHAMCLISDKTKDSWWVPYELGYAKKSEKKISSLKLKGNVELPDFLKVGKIIKGIQSLNEYIEKIISEHKETNIYSSINESLESYLADEHPLENTLDRYR